MRDRAADILAEEADLARTLAATWERRRRPRAFPPLHLPFDRLLAHTDAAGVDGHRRARGPRRRHGAAAGWNPVVGDGAALVAPARTSLLADGYRLVVARRRRRLGRPPGRLLGDTASRRSRRTDGDLPPARRAIVVAAARAGLHPPAVKLAVLAEADVTGRRRAHRRARPRQPRQPGLLRRPQARRLRRAPPARRRPLRRHGQAGHRRRRARLPAARVPGRRQALRPVRPDRRGPPLHRRRHARRLSRLGGGDWQKTKARVRSAVAGDRPGAGRALPEAGAHARATPSPPTRPWQRELEEAFPYERDARPGARPSPRSRPTWRPPVPMDRLVCGDVGFGKTEVAIRAAFKAVQDGKQAAVLVPTTLLAQQHFQTFSDRFAGYPVRVEVLSPLPHRRARPARWSRASRSGEVDVVIGTHRLLSERHPVQGPRPARGRRGAALRRQPQGAIKQLTTDVDVLTLTATPIPRTLEMSLTGIRDLTLLNTPPAERQPILTYVGEYDERAVAEAIRRELLREGQVFFVHNRVQDIEHVAAGLRTLVPEARIAVAHGQMDEGTPRAGRARLLGGRVRRARLHHDHRVGHRHAHGQHARRRPGRPARPRPAPPAAGPGRPGRAAGLRLPVLPARPGAHRGGLRAAARPSARPPSSGRGFKIAMRDLEIRGAGNLLGTGQSGHIAAVGYDLYCQMVNEAVAELKGEEVREPAEIKLDLPARRQPPARLRRQGGAAARGLPAAGRGHHRGRGRRHPGRVGGPLRPGARRRPRRCSRSARLRAECVPHRGPGGGRHQGPGLRGGPLRRPLHPARAQDQPNDPPRAPLQGRRLQGGGRAGAGAAAGSGVGTRRSRRGAHQYPSAPDR